MRVLPQLVIGVLTTCALGANGASVASVGPESAGHSHTRPVRPVRAFTVAASGDVLTEGPVVNVAASLADDGARYDFAPMFAPVASIVGAADLAICHMEVPVGGPTESPGTKGRSPYGGNLLLAPYEVAAGLRATGFDRCSTASNHSNDLGPAGIGSTLDAFDAVGITHVGTARTEREAGVSTFLVGGVRVAHLAYTKSLNTNGTDRFRLNYTRSAMEIAGGVTVARLLGAEVVIVSIHIGQELAPAPTGAERAFIEELTAGADIDLIIEHGPHVVQPVEQVNGTWVFWSVGNFVSAMGTASTGRYADPRTLDGLIAQVRFTETAAGSGEFTALPVPIAICNERSTRTVYPVVNTLFDQSIDSRLRTQMEQCLGRSARVVGDLR